MIEQTFMGNCVQIQQQHILNYPSLHATEQFNRHTEHWAGYLDNSAGIQCEHHVNRYVCAELARLGHRI